ncbi:DUF1499 domain-containing protein [Halioxenophilus sp. WMMB6]|uniref:DUF1499 domain-containing protein n=1 Tax=Halioxenophilus sp. WMMB6 TaxID=3073815 RepID=UPI00295F161D|nr:DUF1499 domain-containing protein [Halioxenophilus sp. WMMB6]
MFKNIVIGAVVVLLILAVLLVLRFFALGKESRQASAPGLLDGQLHPCPKSPNCVNSEYPVDTAHYVPAIELAADVTTPILTKANDVITAMGGVVVEQTESYLAAEFTSKLFGFVDDFELRFDEEKGVLQVRSASRVGYGDMGVNGKRVAAFREAFANAKAPSLEQ